LKYETDKRAKTEWIKTKKGSSLLKVHHNISFECEKTHLFLIGSGLGDIAVMHQIGVTFLDMCDTGEDPELGKVVISFGSSFPSFYPIKGDHNLWWCWGHTEDWIEHYLKNVKIPPSLVLCPSKKCQEEVMGSHDVETLYAPLGVADVFKPLGLKRSGIGYSGIEQHSSIQMNKILYPVMCRRDFEWRKDEWLILDKYNEWCNSKLITLGMIKEVSRKRGMLTNRVFEAFASGTPLIYPSTNGFQKTFGFDYRYQTDSASETVCIIGNIMADPESAIRYMQKISKITHKNHNYHNRLRLIFDALGGKT
jgi:hypothetical protein